MPIASTHHELTELGGGLFQHTQHMKPVGFYDGGTLRRIDPDWRQGNAELPHLITLAKLMTGVDDKGMRRFYPTRELDRYFYLGTPYVKVGGVWRKVGFSGATRTANTITWSRTQADLSITFGGHFCKLDIALKGGYVPEGGLIAFPVGMQGLTRSGANILRDGVPVCHLRVPDVYDAADLMAARRPIAYQFTNLSGQPYLLLTLPSLAGVTSPVIDPSINLQPDATDGVDTMLQDAGGATNNAGVLANVDVGKDNVGGFLRVRRTLIKFNLTTLPADAIVGAATLSLYLTTDWCTSGQTFSVYRQKRAWVEGTRADINDAPPTGATWARYDTVNNWTTAGGFHADDCEQVSIGDRAMGAAEALNEFKAWTLSPTTKTALDLGNGWMVKCVGEGNASGYRFNSSDHAAANTRPKLDITYTVPQGWGFPMRLGVPR